MKVASFTLSQHGKVEGVGCAKSFTSWEGTGPSTHRPLPLDKPLRLLLTPLSSLVKRGQYNYYSFRVVVKVNSGKNGKFPLKGTAAATAVVWLGEL